MSKHKKITVRGRQRSYIDPVLLAAVLVSISDGWHQDTGTGSSPDVFNAAIEDWSAGAV